MRTARSRMPKNFSLEDRLAACADAVESNPASWAGRWRFWTPRADCAAVDSAAPVEATAAPCDRGGASAEAAVSFERPRATRDVPYARVCLDLGCGKGEYTVACAKAHPDVLFIGLDIEGVCVMRGAERALAEGVENAVFVFEEDPDLDLSTLFAPGELDAILLNFSTPFPKKKKAPLRLTYVDRLIAYRAVLAEGGMVRLRTDSQPLRDFSLTQLELAGYDLRWSTDDVRAMFPDEPWSGYESKLVAKGATVYGFEAVPRLPGPDPESIVQTAPLSLVSYLPEDIESLGYVPHGMQGCVENMRGRRANRRAKGLPEWTRPIV